MARFPGDKKKRQWSGNHFPAKRIYQFQPTFPPGNILLVGDSEVLLELVQPDVGVSVTVKTITATVETDGEGRAQLVGQICLPGGQCTCWVLFGSCLVPGWVDRVGGGKLKISVNLHWVLVGVVVVVGDGGGGIGGGGGGGGDSGGYWCWC